MSGAAEWWCKGQGEGWHDAERAAQVRVSLGSGRGGAAGRRGRGRSGEARWGGADGEAAGVARSGRRRGGAVEVAGAAGRSSAARDATTSRVGPGAKLGQALCARLGALNGSQQHVHVDGPRLTTRRLLHAAMFTRRSRVHRSPPR